MSQKIQFRRGLLSESAGVVLDQGEPAWAVDTKQLFMGDGVTAGGVLISGGSAQTSSNVGVTGISITGGISISGAVSITGLGGIEVFQNGQIIQISGYSTIDGGTF
jgi:hypothetical protein